jgi:hypothetical protein
MNDIEDTLGPPPPRKKGRFKTFLLGALLVLGLLVILVLASRWQLGRVGQENLAATTASLDTQDPNWRLEQIEDARTRAVAPGGKNPSLIILDFQKNQLPAWQKYRSFRTWDWEGPTNELPSFTELVWLLGAQKYAEEPRDVLHRELLKPDVISCASGRYPLVMKDNPLSILLPHIQDTRAVIDFLDSDSRLALLGNRPDWAVESARAALLVTRSIGDEPFLISQLVRMACARVSAGMTLQTLAWSTPSQGLAELQRELATEADFPHLGYAFRGERGMCNQFFEGLMNGKIDLDEGIELLRGKREDESRFLRHMGFAAYRAFLPGDQSKYLELMTAYVEVTKLPHHERKEAFAQIPRPPRPPEDFRYLVTNILIPATNKILESSLRTRALLLSASVAVACERYRLRFGKWPGSLSDIPAEILPAIPTDPYDGTPLKYRTESYGVIVYTVGEETDRAPSVAGRVEPNPTQGLGCGWKLWNPELRRQARVLPEEK